MLYQDKSKTDLNPLNSTQNWNHIHTQNTLHNVYVEKLLLALESIQPFSLKCVACLKPKIKTCSLGFHKNLKQRPCTFGYLPLFPRLSPNPKLPPPIGGFVFVIHYYKPNSLHSNTKQSIQNRELRTPSPTFVSANRISTSFLFGCYLDSARLIDFDFPKMQV